MGKRGPQKTNIGLCIVEGCLNPQEKRHWCGKHYRRWFRYGDVSIVKKRKAWNKGMKGLFSHTEEFKERARQRWLGKNNPRWKGGEIRRICECGKEFWTFPCKIRSGRGKHCSRKCFVKYHREIQKGSNSHFWKGGITPLYNAIRNLPEYREWRNKVYKKDNYRCQECFKGGSCIEAHHKKDFAIILAEFLKEYDQFSPIEDKETLIRLATKYEPFWDIDNGETLCRDCHELTDSYPKNLNNKEMIL